MTVWMSSSVDYVLIPFSLHLETWEWTAAPAEQTLTLWRQIAQLSFGENRAGRSTFTAKRWGGRAGYSWAGRIVFSVTYWLRWRNNLGLDTLTQGSFHVVNMRQKEVGHEAKEKFWLVEMWKLYLIYIAHRWH